MFSCKNCGVVVIKETKVCPVCTIPADPIYTLITKEDGTKGFKMTGRNMGSLWIPIPEKKR